MIRQQDVLYVNFSLWYHREKSFEINITQIRGFLEEIPRLHFMGVQKTFWELPEICCVHISLSWLTQFLTLVHNSHCL